jgi:hypothetical protein
MDVRSISATRQPTSKYISVKAYFAKQISLFGTYCLPLVLKRVKLHLDYSRLSWRASRPPRQRYLPSPPLCFGAQDTIMR